MNNSSSVKKKVLVVRFSSMGDIVLTTPIVRVLSENYEVHFLTKSKFSLLLKSNPFITKMVTVEKDIHEVINELRAEDYDYVVDLHNNLRTFRLKRSLGRPSFTFSKINFKKWLSVRLKSVSVLPEKHIVDRMFRAIEPLGLSYDAKGLDFFLSSGLELPEVFYRFNELHPDYYVFSIGGTYFTKRCSERKVVDICRSINKAVVLLGGHEEYESGNRIAEELSLPVLNLCGVSDILQSAQIVSQSKFVVSNDTGLMHIAAALKLAVVSLWGNTVPEFGMYPFYPDGFEPMAYIAQVEGLTCRPCSKLGYDKCPRGHFRCMEEIDTHGIIAYLEKNNLI